MTNSIPSSRIYIPLYFSTVLMLIIYNIVRIINVPVTYDEAYTYLVFLNGNYADIINFKIVIANNHILNSLLSKFFISILGDTQFSLRLPNLLAQLIFIVYSYLFFKKTVANKWLAFVCFLIINTNPFLFDFWGLCRGYGLSIALMMGSVYHYLQYYNQRIISRLYLSLLFAVLSVYSNFSQLHYFMALACVVITMHLFHIKNNKKDLFKAGIALIISFTVLALLIGSAVKKLQGGNMFSYGGTEGLVKDTFSSLIRESIFLDSEHPALLQIASYIAFFAIIFIGINWVYLLIKHRTDRAVLGFLLWLLCSVSILSIELQHLLLDSRYVIERTALFLWPLFIIQFLYWLLNAHSRFTPIHKAILILTLVTCISNFIYNANIRYARSWKFNQYTQVVVNRIFTHPNRPIHLKLHWLLIPSFQYYQSLFHKDDLIISAYADDKPQETTWFEYYFIDREDIGLIPVNEYKIDTTFDDGRYVLLRRQ